MENVRLFHELEAKNAELEVRAEIRATSCPT